MRLIYLGTPQFAVPPLASLLAAGHEIVAVITQPDRPVGRKQVLTPPPVKLLAEAHGLPVHQPEKIRTPEARAIFEPLFSAVDAAVVAAYGRILPGWMLAAPRLGCLNIHSSLLPKYRGAAPINWAIAEGETETGVTLMQMDEGMDTGAIIAQRRVTIGADETAAELTRRLADLGAELLIGMLPEIAGGKIEAVAQDESAATLAPILKREDGAVDWSLTARQISTRRRGFTPFPGCHTFLAGQRLELVGVAPLESVAPGADTPGTITRVERESFAVRCGAGTELRVTTVQPAGKREMSVRDFLNGVKLQVGDQLGDRMAGD
ncbi:MAG: methionyl-tRNA formyltransferase, partial [Acidobacteriota bacterium]